MMGTVRTDVMTRMRTATRRVLATSLHTRPWTLTALIVVALTIVHAPAAAQEHAHTAGMVHTPGMKPKMPTELPKLGGQSAFAAISEVLRMLEADSTTDWSRVNLERLRQHLIDMDLVTMRSRATATDVPGGAAFTVRGSGETIAAIQRMTRAHVAMAESDDRLTIVRTQLPDGARLTVTSRTPNDAKSIAHIRALGFIGLMVAGDHHPAHHLMLAQGAAMTDHGH